MIILGFLCGSLYGTNNDRQDLLIYYLLFNTLFAVVVATSTISTLSAPQARELLFTTPIMGYPGYPYFPCGPPLSSPDLP
jgi:hypothetical protein